MNQFQTRILTAKPFIATKCQPAQWLNTIIATVLMATFVPTYAAAENRTAVLVLDSSKSMWGQINGLNKVVIARNSLENAFTRAQGKINLGIVTYGHRKSVGCKDIEAILTPRPINIDVFKETIGNVRPKGSTPIASALRVAARLAGVPKVPATIVLLSDGLDNCRQDPCATAAKLKVQSSALKIDVIAFDKQTQRKLAALKCISDKTGGKFYTATNAKELTAALNASFDNIRGPEAPEQDPNKGFVGWAPEESDEPDVPAVQETEILATNESNTTIFARTPVPGSVNSTQGLKSTYSFTATLSDNGRTIPNGLIWRLYNVAKKAGAKPVLIKTARVPNPEFVLKPGRYLITVTYGRAHVTRFITAQPGERKDQVIVLNAGGLRLASVLANSVPVNKNDVRFDIYSDERDQFSKRELVMKGAKPGLIIRLNSGIYHLKSTYGDANATVEADVTVEAGKLTEAAVNHRSGKVTFKLVRKEGGEALARTQWHIQTTDGKTVAKSIGAFPTHILAAGRYIISAKHEGRKFQGQFDVFAGDSKQIEVVAR